jgi:catechol 2,3-dioxygenase-like lactoylglutathione lyase family enzyme
MPTITGSHHVGFTVRDADASAKWYADLLGMQEVLRGDDDTLHFRVLAHPESGCVIGVRQYPEHADGRFDEFRTGLDHFALGVASRADLEAWEQRLSDTGIPFTPIAETPIGSVIVFRDPDNIQLELFLPAG